MKPMASIAAIACLAFPAIVCAQGPTSFDAILAQSAAQSAPVTAWQVPARLIARTGGGHLKEPKGVLVSDPVTKHVRFEGNSADAFDVAYDQITGMHYEDGARYPSRRFNKHVEFYLTIRYSDNAGKQRASSVRFDKDNVEPTLSRLESDMGLLIDRTVARRSFQGLPIRVAVGDRVVVTDVAGRTLKGKITDLSDLSLGVTEADTKVRIFDEGGVEKIRLRYSAGRDAMSGLGVGAAIGGGFGFAFCTSFGNCGARDVPAILAIAGLVGGILSAEAVVVGAIVHRFDKSQDVYLGHSGASSSSARPSVGVGPIVGWKRRGLAMSVTF